MIDFISKLFDSFIEILASLTLFIDHFIKLIKFLFTSLPFTLIDFVACLPVPIASGIGLLIGTIAVILILKLIAIVRAKWGVIYGFRYL